jgi:penicillin V acylase-like amidase (Ntn superfamily)
LVFLFNHPGNLIKMNLMTWMNNRICTHWTWRITSTAVLTSPDCDWSISTRSKPLIWPRRTAVPVAITIPLSWTQTQLLLPYCIDWIGGNV